MELTDPRVNESEKRLDDFKDDEDLKQDEIQNQDEEDNDNEDVDN